MGESMDEAEATDEVKMIATNIERPKIKTSETSRMRKWSNIGERFSKAALDSLSLERERERERERASLSFVEWGDQSGDERT